MSMTEYSKNTKQSPPREVSFWVGIMSNEVREQDAFMEHER